MRKTNILAKTPLTLTGALAAIFYSLVTIGAMASPPEGYSGDCAVTYSEFEEAIPHIDMLTCPEVMGISDDDGFCRVVFEGNQPFVYGFEYGEEDACLTTLREVPLSGFLQKD